jgi:hypothetical protein
MPGAVGAPFHDGGIEVQERGDDGWWGSEGAFFDRGAEFAELRKGVEEVIDDAAEAGTGLGESMREVEDDWWDADFALVAAYELCLIR